MARNLFALKNLKLIVFKKNRKVSVPQDSVLIMQAFVPYYWPDELELSKEQRLFFWNLHPQNLIPSLLPIPFFRELPINNFGVYKFLSIFYKRLFSNLRSYVQLLLDTNSLCFMDKTNLDFTSKYLFIDIKNQKYLPITAESPAIELFVNEDVLLGETIHIGWVGRLCDFKSYILVYTINKLSEIADRFSNKKFIYHIVGDGAYLEYIKNNIKVNNLVSVIFHGSIPHNKLDKFINCNIDILTAMGTSALEGAKLGKPTILLDPILKEVKKDYKFRLLYNTQEFDLAHFITESDYEAGNESLFRIINEIISDYALHSKRSLEYFRENHSIEKLSDMLLKKALNSELTFSIINPSFLKKGIILTIYNRFRNLSK
jgi:hypothetical protein